MTTTRQDESLRKTGECALASILEFAAALECDYDRLEELKGERDYYEPEDDDKRVSADGQLIGVRSWADANPDDAAELKDLIAAANCNGSPCESREEAETRVHEDALSVEVRSGWTTLGEELTAEEYCILLTTGGPAVRIVGDLDGGEPTTARLEVQDWGTPWTEHITTGTDHEALLTYARCFYFGE